MTLDEKLDWIAQGIMHLLKKPETPFYDELLQEYFNLFHNTPKPKPEEQNKRKGLFLK